MLVDQKRDAGDIRYLDTSSMLHLRELENETFFENFGKKTTTTTIVTTATTAGV